MLDWQLCQICYPLEIKLLLLLLLLLCQNSSKFLSFLYLLKTSHVIMKQLFIYNTPGHA